MCTYTNIVCTCTSTHAHFTAMPQNITTLNFELIMIGKILIVLNHIV